VPTFFARCVPNVALSKCAHLLSGKCFQVSDWLAESILRVEFGLAGEGDNIFFSTYVLKNQSTDQCCTLQVTVKIW